MLAPRGGRAVILDCPALHPSTVLGDFDELIAHIASTRDAGRGLGETRRGEPVATEDWDQKKETSTRFEGLTLAFSQHHLDRLFDALCSIRIHASIYTTP